MHIQFVILSPVFLHNRNKLQKVILIVKNIPEIVKY